LFQIAFKTAMKATQDGRLRACSRIPWCDFRFERRAPVDQAKLALEVMNWVDGARKRWSDGRGQSLESMLKSIADGILYHVHFDRAPREERDADERRRKHLAYRRDLQQKRLKRESGVPSFVRGWLANLDSQPVKPLFQLGP
jgi:hypothetical protein